MNYIYNVELNFLPVYFDFYEWRTDDKISNYKKLPIFLVTTKQYLILKYNEVTLDVSSLPKIGKYLLVTNKCEVMALEITDKYEVIKRSSLLFDEADEILENLNKMKITELKFKHNVECKHPPISRKEYEINKYLSKFYNKMQYNMDEYLLKYIYYELYNKEESDLNKILIKLKEEDKYKVYDTIQIVNKELNNYIKL